jgi:ABC-type branched-subunit amino acid transport system ATPase component
MLLRAESISKRFGGVVALDAVGLEVASGEIVGLIGPNGSGKTTLADVVTGFYTPDAGSIRLDDLAVVGMPSHVLRKNGIARTFQNLRLFGDLTVLDNLLIGQHVAFLAQLGVATGWVRSLLRTAAAREAERRARARALEVLEWIGLADKAPVKARELSYGQRKRVEFGRAVVVPPRILVLDEPLAGVSLDETSVVTDLMRQTVRDLRAGILFIEHRLELVWPVCDRIMVLNAGRHVVTGTPAAVRAHDDVRRAYLGE